MLLKLKEKFTWGLYLPGTQNRITDISKKSWIFLILLCIATGLYWLCYYKALQIGGASKVVPVDKFSVVITMILAFILLYGLICETIFISNRHNQYSSV